jgi:hypothetical protein
MIWNIFRTPSDITEPSVTEVPEITLKALNTLNYTDINTDDIDDLIDSLNFNSDDMVKFNRILKVKLNMVIDNLTDNISEVKTANLRGQVELIKELLNLQNDRKLAHEIRRHHE